MMSQSCRLPRRVWRLQRHSPASTALIVATLTAGIAAAVTVFSVVDPILLRQLPFDRPAQLRVVTTGFPRMKMSGMGLSGPEALELPAMTHVFSAAGPVTFDTVTIGGSGAALRASAVLASAAALDALRPATLLGRVYGEEEDRAGAARVALLSEPFWRRAFGADPNMVGRPLLVDGRSTVVVGIMAPRVDLFDRQIDVWLPLLLTRATAGSRSDHRFTVLARVAPTVGEAAAVTDIAAAVAGWQQATGEFHSPAPTFHPLEVRTLVETTSGPVARPLGALGAAVLLVLLIACANAASLMLERAETRRAQAAIEVALGAGLRHLAALYLVEALALSSAASACGVAAAAFVIQGLRSFGPALVRPDDLVINGRVLMFAAASALATTALIAVAPILTLTPGRAYRWLQAGGRGSIGAAHRQRLQRTLVAIQVAVAVVLSVGGVVTVRSLIALTNVDVGFRADVVMHAQVSLPQAPYESADARVWSFYEELLSRIGALPGVHAAAVMSGAPPLRPANNTTFALDGSLMFDHNNVPQVDFVQHVDGDYFAAMNIPLRAGRAFTGADAALAAPVAIVNETLARRFWPGRSAIGHRLRPAIAGVPWFTVVGVAGDVRQAGVQAPAGSEVYVPYRQSRVLLPDFLPRTMHVVARGSAPDPGSLVRSMQQIVRELEPAAAVSGGGTMQDVVDRSIASPTLLSWLLNGFAAVAVLLAAVGVYGVTAATVVARTAEFGVRVALGATPADVIRHVIRAGTPAIAIGAVAGSGAAIVGVRYLSTLLFAVDRWSFGAIAAVAAALGLIAIASALIPAVRAARLDPLTALRAH